MALLVPMILVYTAVLPALDRIEELKEQLAAQDRALLKIQTLAHRYETMSAQSDDLIRACTARPREFTLFAHIEGLAQKTQLKSHIGYMKPGERSLKNNSHRLARVKLRLKRVELAPFMDFLSHVEDRKLGVGIASLTLSRSGKEGQTQFLDVVMDIQTLIPGGKAP